MIRTLALLIGLFPHMLFAEKLNVRSGEHVDFSRLVISLDPGQTWALGRVENGYRLQVNDLRDGFDLSEVFVRIPRDRIGDLTPDPNGLQISMNCECHADAFEFRPGLLVIDIKDGDPTRFSRFEAELVADEIRAEPVAVIETSQAPAQVAKAPTPDPVRDQSDIVSAVDLPLVSTNAPSVALKEPGADAARIADLKTEILEQLSRAAAQGLVEANPTLENQEVSPAERAPTPIEVALPPDFKMPRRTDNYVAETQVDRDRPARKSLRLSSQTCLPDTLFNITDWGEPSDAMQALRTARRQILLEFDEHDGQAVLDLTRAYLYAGFGAEAQATLKAFPIEFPDQDILRDIANILDGRPPEEGTRLKTQIQCNNSAAFWAVLVSQPTERDDLKVPKVLGYFSALPIHLRSLLGPRLAEKFLALGDIASVKSVQNAILRVEGTKNSELELVEVEMLGGQKDPEESISSLQEIVERNDSSSLEATSRLLALANRERTVVSDIHLENAEALVFEHRNTDVEKMLLPLVVEANVIAGKNQRAIENLKSSSQDSPELWQATLWSIVRNGNDTDVLSVAVDPSSAAHLRGKDGELRAAYASRLAEAGFAESAMSLIKSVPEPTEMDQILLAKFTLESDGLDLTQSKPDENEVIDTASVQSSQVDEQASISNAVELNTGSEVEVEDPSQGPLGELVTLARSKRVLDESAAIRLEAEELIGRGDAPPKS